MVQVNSVSLESNEALSLVTFKNYLGNTSKRNKVSYLLFTKILFIKIVKKIWKKFENNGTNLKNQWEDISILFTVHKYKQYSKHKAYVLMFRKLRS